MTHMVCWFPDIKKSSKILDVLRKYSEFIEIQFPFSDPIADGMLIEKANQVTLKQWMTTEKCFDFVEMFGKNILGKNSNIIHFNKGDDENIKKPKILIMTYYNIVLNYWVEEFVKKAKSIWIYGFIIPDIPFDEEDWKNMRKICSENNIIFTELVSPETSISRLEKITSLKPNLLYAISQNMTTWSKAEFSTKFENYILKLKKYFPETEIWVWFWVKNKEDVEKICKIADFAIIGSELIKVYENWWIKSLENYLKNIKN